jgi:D-alanyl-D-alanine dipeptidase
MSKQAIYQSMEDKMLRYADLVGVPVRPISEKLVPIKPTTNLMAKPIDNDMAAYTGNMVFVRKTVAVKLEQASKLLSKIDPRLQLQIVYGYRALSIQQKLFRKYKQQLKAKYTGEELLEAVHRLIAVPEIAGHPTGGAIDIQIIKFGKPVSLGTRIWEFNNDSFTFSPFVSRQAQENRQLLRSVMMEVGFAPFDGEWWHFSYGDKEWAKYFEKPHAIYEQVEFCSENHWVK